MHMYFFFQTALKPQSQYRHEMVQKHATVSDSSFRKVILDVPFCPLHKETLS